MQPLGAEDPRTIGAYRIVGRLGSGGMGRVYLGRSSGGRTVAVKVVHPHFALDEQFRARFRREVSAARRVGGRWTAPVLDADPEARVPWVATGYVAGPSLSQAVADTGPLPEASVRALAVGLAEALAAVHALALVHRDVKPSNVLLALDGPRLIDFGIARATEGTVSLTSTGASIGSPGYMSPEQILGKVVDSPTDVFSLGAVLAYAATGAGPFPGDSSASLLYKVVHEEPVLGPGLAPDLRELVAACLAKEPGERPTPEQIVRQLAPDGGAAGLVRSGWLPGPLVEQISRQAVDLLDLEAAAPVGSFPAAGVPGAGAPAPGVPAPGVPAPGVPGAAPGAGPDIADQPPGTAQPLDPSAAPALGTFGPPDPGYGSGHPGAGPATVPPQPGGSAVPQDAADRQTPADAAGRQRPAGAPADVSSDADASGDSLGGRRIALSASLGGKGRPRAVSCSLVLSIAGALALATTATVFLRGLSDDETANADKGRQPGASQTPTGADPDYQTPEPGSSVSPAFIGTWRGNVVQADGMPNGTMTATIAAGKPGDTVVHIKYEVKVESVGLSCFSKGKLTAADRERLTARESTDPGKPSDFGCTGNSTTVTFTLGKDGRLVFKSRDADGGKPTAELRRTDGD